MKNYTPFLRRVLRSAAGWSLCCIVLAGYAGSAHSQELDYGLSYAYGTPAAPSLQLAGINDRAYRLSDYSGRVVIVNFWATWCPPCIAELPTLTALYTQLHEQGLDVLAVNLGEPKAEVENFLKAFHTPLRFPVLMAPTPDDISGWEITALPQSYIINRSGNVEYTALGPKDFGHPELVKRIQAMLDSGG